MPIFIPGKRDRHGRLRGGQRSAVATLQLTAMVDLFTVLAVFLLQNYASTGEVIFVPRGMELPMASSIKNLKPSNVLIISESGISMNEKRITSYLEVKTQKDWMIESLKKQIIFEIEEGKRKKLISQNKLRSKLKKAKKGSQSSSKEKELEDFYRITIQSDKKMDFLTVKKVVYTAMEAGIREVNFAVLQKESKVPN